MTLNVAHAAKEAGKNILYYVAICAMMVFVAVAIDTRMFTKPPSWPPSWVTETETARLPISK